jgi:hypothetical protein
MSQPDSLPCRFADAGRAAQPEDKQHRRARETEGTVRFRRAVRPEVVAAWRAAAETGDAEAMVSLARLAVREPGTGGNAEQLLRSAAALENAEAILLLGLMLWGRGEDNEGEDLIQRSALLGRPDAMATMGAICALRGDRTASAAWYAALDASDPRTGRGKGRWPWARRRAEWPGAPTT